LSGYRGCRGQLAERSGVAAIGLPVVICGGAVVTWIVRLVRWSARRGATP